jgi:hypothetical protein
VDISVTKPGYIPYVQSASINIKQAIDLQVSAGTQHGRVLSPSIAVLPPGGKVITKKSDVNSPVEIKNADLAKYTKTAPNHFEDPSGKYKFVAWSDGIMDNPRSTNIYVDTNLTAIYSASYYLDITTPEGTAAGSGYYPEETSATISVSPAVVQGIISDKSFVGWSGDIQADTTSATVLMDGPKSVVATWHENYLKAIIIGAVGGSGAGVFIYLKKIKPMRKQKAQEEEDAAPGLDWFKP